MTGISLFPGFDLQRNLRNAWSLSELASFPGPAQLSVAYSTVKLGGAWERG